MTVLGKDLAMFGVCRDLLAPVCVLCPFFSDHSVF